MKRILPIFATLWFSALPASAFCGLASCPRPSGSGEVAFIEAGLRTRWVAFDVAGNEGSYVVTAPRLFVRRFGVTLGAEVPLTRLENGGAVTTGLSNPVLMALYGRRLSATWSAEVGTQWELPFGNSEDGLAGDHMMLLPWVGARHEFGHAWYATAMAGYSRALDHAESSAPGGSARLAKVAHEGHDHGGTTVPVLVNPHADEEIQARAAVGWTHGRSTLEGFALAQTDLTDAATGTYARAGASWEWTLARFTAVQIIADAPVTSARRNEAEIGLALKTGL